MTAGKIQKMFGSTFKYSVRLFGSSSLSQDATRKYRSAPRASK